MVRLSLVTEARAPVSFRVLLPYPNTVRALAAALGASDDETASLLEAVPRGPAPQPEAAP